MPTREEFHARVIRMQQHRLQALAEQRQGQRQVAEQARTVVNHPGWQMLCDHLDAVRRSLTDRAAALSRQMEDGQDLGEALTALKLQLREIKGELRGIDTALALIPSLLVLGEAAKRVEADATA